MIKSIIFIKWSPLWYYDINIYNTINDLYNIYANITSSK